MRKLHLRKTYLFVVPKAKERLNKLSLPLFRERHCMNSCQAIYPSVRKICIPQLFLVQAICTVTICVLDTLHGLLFYIYEVVICRSNEVNSALFFFYSAYLRETSRLRKLPKEQLRTKLTGPSCSCGFEEKYRLGFLAKEEIYKHHQILGWSKWFIMLMVPALGFFN